MNRRAAKIGLLALALLALCLCGAAALYADRGGAAVRQDALAFRVESGSANAAKTVRCVPDGDTLRVFLPAYARMDRVRVLLPSGAKLTLDGTPLRDGMSCAGFPQDAELALTGDGLEAKLVFLASANVATMYIDTAAGDMEAVHEDKWRKVGASVALYDADGALDYHTRLSDSLRGHGQSTWLAEKKPYNLYLNRAADLLGMSAAKKWVLISNVNDESCLRNWLAYTVAGQVAPYPGFAPECRFVDLYLNGSYNGLYLLCEKVEIHPNRLDIDDQSWLFSFEQAERKDTFPNCFDFGEGIVVRVKHPAECSDGERDVLEAHLSDFQAALLAEDGISPGSGRAWDDFIDLDSFARKYLIEEIFQNCDAGSCSQYFFWNAGDDRLYAGPCWDYDRTLGNYSHRIPNCFYAQREWKSPHIYTPWFHALWSREAFRERVLALYRSEFEPALRTMMETGLPQKIEELRSAVALNTVRWRSIFETTDFTSDLDYTLDYMKKHVDFLNSAWIDGVDYKTVAFRILDITPYQFFCLPAGSSCEALPTPEFFWLEDCYWALPDGTPLDTGTALTEDLWLEPRTSSGELAEDFSPRLQAAMN